MATVKNTTTTTAPKKQNKQAGTLFSKKNHLWMAVGGVLIVLGFILMLGGASKDPNQFIESEVYSTMRITIAPFFVLCGLGVLAYAIMRKSE